MLSNKINSDRRTILPLLWIFYVLNILYADVLNNLGSLATMGTGQITDEVVEALLTPKMILIAAFILEAAMVMVICSRILPYKANRIMNIVVALLEIMVGTAALFVGEPPIYYYFFTAIEIPTLFFIIWYAWNWTESAFDNNSDTVS